MAIIRCNRAMYLVLRLTTTFVTVIMAVVRGLILPLKF